MKVTLAFVLTLLGLYSSAYAADFSRYQTVKQIQSLTVTQPAIVELSDLDPARIFVVANDKGEAIEQQYVTDRKISVELPLSVEACMQKCVNAQALADANPSTTFDFPLTTSGVQKGTITITYAKPLTTDRVTFTTTADSYMPNSFQLTIDGKRVLNTIQGSQATFPMQSAQKVVIAFEYSQPIRFREVGVGTVTREEVHNMIRFVYQPGVTYSLYVGDSIGRENIPTPPINLFAKPKEFEVTTGPEVKNPLFKERPTPKEIDTDADGVFDISDNCLAQPNPDQKDGNGNGIGDTCDDYDYDGVATYRDNCPFISNFNQSDTDRDGIGDTCDQEESRFTEKHGWVPWLAFGTVLSIILAMGYEVMRKIKK